MVAAEWAMPRLLPWVHRMLAVADTVAVDMAGAAMAVLAAATIAER
jgi:hypothetical protein